MVISINVPGVSGNAKTNFYPFEFFKSLVKWEALANRNILAQKIWNELEPKLAIPITKKTTNKAVKQGYIYLFEGNNILKLGYSVTVNQRLRNLSRWKGELELVKKIKGTITQEKSLHSLLHSTGDYCGDEWYPIYRKHEIIQLMDINKLANISK